MRHSLFWLVLMMCAGTAAAQSACRQALALGLDVSGSVDAEEYRLQLDGLSSALGAPDVVQTLLAQPAAPVRIAIFEWSTPGEHRLVLNWTEITDRSVISDVQSLLRETDRAPMGPGTGLGAALQDGFALLDQQADCWKRTLDISGDGKNNMGQRPQGVDVAPPGVTVNGLVIGVDDANGGHERALQIGELTAYYTAYVIRGPDAFVETALGYDDYANAMRRKLLRELASLAVARIGVEP